MVAKVLGDKRYPCQVHEHTAVSDYKKAIIYDQYYSTAETASVP